MVSIEVLKDNNSTIIDFGANSKIDDRKPEEPDRSCNVCGFGPCKTRCSLCKSVYYCSTECQRKDWIKGGHRINCTGRKKSKKGVKQTKNQIPIGPLPPPPTSVRNEHDAKTALEELWSFTDTAISGVEHQNGDAQKIKPKLSSEIKNRPQTKRQTPTVTTRAQSDMNRSDLGVDDCQHDSIATSCEEEAGNDVSFVVEEMPQICCFQLTLTKQRKRQRNETSNTYSLRLQTSIAVSIQPLGQARSRTLVTVRATEGQLFAGEFPRPLQKSDITWTISENKNSVALDDESQIGDVMIVLRLPYPYDASNTSSMALGGSLDDSYNYASLSESTLDEINSVVCGACHLPLIAKNAKHKPIARAFPLPQGHWDEIADYLICYDGQPMIDFSAGSECAEPSIALQDSSLLCIHRKDVEAAVCALAVDGYGELTEEMESKNELGSTPTNMDGNDFGTFSAKPASSSFVLPYEPKSTDEIKPATETANTSNGNTKNNEPEISASSAVVRGDRTWQDAVDGESVSLCCARCSSPLGFCSLGSPETWRFWKHRLSIPESTARTQQNNEQPKLRYPMTLPFTKPLAACSSFLARELVRYAESKAIFTFVVRREELNHNPSCTEMENECLLLRLLSWETAMATSFESKPNSKRLRFCKVAKIVFELASDPTVTRLETKHDFNGEVPAQWFWGGVDLCCPPAGNMLNTSTDIDDAPSAGAVSTVRLQLPSDDYDSVLKDLVSNKALFEPEIAKATILLKMGGLSEGLGLTAVPLH